MLLKESIVRMEKDSELQYILLFLDGANSLFSGNEIQFINRTFESVYVKSEQTFEKMFDGENSPLIQSEKKNYTEILNAKIF